MKIPSDRKILRCIFDKYKNDYIKFDNEKNRTSKIYVPINCEEIAKALHSERDIIFGRLYYYLEEKYGYTQSDGSKVHLFSLQVGSDPKCVNFPLLASVLAGLEEEKSRYTITQVLAIIAILISASSFVVSCTPQNEPNPSINRDGPKQALGSPR